MRNLPIIRLLVVLLVAANLIVAATAVATGVGYILQAKTLSSDTSFYAEVARADLNGGTLYIDRWDNKPPVVFWYLGVFLRLLGSTIHTVNLAIIAHNLLLGVVIGLLAYALTGSPPASLLAASIGLLYAIIVPKIETTVLMSTLSVCAMLLAIIGRGRPALMALAGMVFAVGVLTKQPLVFELPILLLFAAYDVPGRRRVAAAGVIAGIMVAVGGFFLWLAIEGNAAAFFRYVIFDAYAYVSTTDGQWYNASFGDRFGETWERFVYLVPFVALAVAALLARARSRKLAVVLLWLVLALVAASTAQDMKFAYFIQALPPMAVLVAMAFDWGYRRSPALLSAFLIGLCLALAGFSHEFVRSTDREEDGDLMAAVAVVQAHSQPTDCLWVWSQYSDVNFTAGRASCASLPMNMVATEEEQYNTRRNQNEMLLDLFQRPPRLHVLVDDDSYFPQLKRFANRYRKQQLLDGSIMIYQVDMSTWHPFPASFGGELALLGYDLPAQARICPGDRLPLALTWRQLRAASDVLQMRVDLVDGQGKPKIDYLGPVTKDNPPFDPLTSGDVWLGSTFNFPLPDNLAPGQYTFALTVFPADTPDQPLTVSSGGVRLPLQSIQVEACGSTG